ncbi:MAG: LysR substrate-binding domain-containing protein [Opitutaceae bacterium]|nr:LysR substrate-binding domain-containing protein [Opitutaceae bacterium]
MELRHLRYFVAVAGEENVTRAARRLHVSQPALSRQIRDLEDELQVLLLERGAQSVRLTEAGRTFLREARAVLERAEAAVATVRSAASGAHAELHVGYAPSLTVQILPVALRNFQKELPRVRVLLHDLTTEEMLAQLREKKIDLSLMVRPGPKQLRGLRVVELARYPLCVAVAPRHPLARSRSLTREQAGREIFIAYTRADYPDYHEQLTGLFGAGLRVAEELDSVTSMIAAVEAGRGVALMPSCLVFLAGPRLKLIPLRPAPEPLVVGAVFRATAPTAALEKFIAAAKVAG